MIIQILSLDMRKALKIALIPPGPDFCTQLHHAHIAVVSYEKFFKISDPIRIRSDSDPDAIHKFFAKKFFRMKQRRLSMMELSAKVRPRGDQCNF